MTGLDLGTFLRLLQADLGAWASLGAILVVLALMTWTSWGKRRVLRKCLVLSVLVHLSLVVYGGRLPAVLVMARRPGTSEKEREVERIKQIRVTPVAKNGAPKGLEASSPNGRPGHRLADWDRPSNFVAMADPNMRPARAEPPRAEPIRRPDTNPPPMTPEAATPEVSPPEPSAPPESRVREVEPEAPPIKPRRVAPVDPSEIAVLDDPSKAESEPGGGPSERVRPDRKDATSKGQVRASSGDIELPGAATPGDGSGGRPRNSPRREIPELAMPDVEGRLRPAAPRPENDSIALATPRRARSALPTIDRATPTGATRLPEVPGGAGRALPEVPEVYRSRLDPNRSVLAQRAGASPASEQAVERSLDWLMRHQDSDGRWNAGSARYKDGASAEGERSFTVHCPPGEICFGECFYWEADTAMTGLALLAYLGAGYTHVDGKYAPTVEKGIQFLVSTQKANGDLRGPSEAVGMYCHAIAGLALCEAYALTGDPALRDPVARAVDFMVKGQATDRMSWRYEPRAPSGDTSILGWVILLLKSAKVVGISVPGEARSGAIAWLEKVSEGKSGGLARYRLNGPARETNVSESMTAEAWVCRQFLGVGGPGEASDEAAAYLLAHGPARGTFNLYYWYYGTLAMYQHGGDSWARWNAQVRDGIVRRQRTDGHAAGSWDPDESQWGPKGGRIYSTALATLTLEVYYRYLRLYDSPGAPPPVMAPGNERPEDADLKRAGRR